MRTRGLLVFASMLTISSGAGARTTLSLELMHTTQQFETGVAKLVKSLRDSGHGVSVIQATKLAEKINSFKHALEKIDSNLQLKREFRLLTNEYYQLNQELLSAPEGAGLDDGVIERNNMRDLRFYFYRLKTSFYTQFGYDRQDGYSDPKVQISVN